MLTEFIYKKMALAKYKILEDGSYFGEIPGLKGVWANEKNLEKCRESLREVIEEWMIIKIKDNDKIPGFKITSNYKVKSLAISKLKYA
jgi:predicted RNase H-like HicB family nuclease